MVTLGRSMSRRRYLAPTFSTSIEIENPGRLGPDYLVLVRMKSVLAFVIALCAIETAHAEIQLRGVAETEGRCILLLFDTDDQGSSQWVGLGSVYRGYTIKQFDQDHSVAHLSKGGVEMLAKLQGGRVKSANSGFVDLAKVSDEELVEMGLYRVQHGDTGTHIASVAGMTLSDLLALNPSRDFKRLRVGQILVISGTNSEKTP
jgi:hypothetical protein